ncbi:MDR family MFS transporter [Marininema halotolerans]|uniref:MDR family MFS transporter n=1 Tax=Marininema halotolerans TaxID=1155944 RepID=UPI000B85EAA2|nr:MFS transporter [Marininema halotolerans]
MEFKDFHLNIKIRIFEFFLSNALSSMIFPFMAIYIAKYYGVKVAGMLLILNVFAGIVVKFIGGYVADHYGRKKSLMVAETLRLVAFVTMLLCNSPWYHSPFITFLMMTVNTICWGLSGPANEAMLIDVSKPEQRKLMYSIVYWSFNLSVGIGAIIGGFFFATHLFELMIALSLGAMVSTVLVVFFIQESYIRSQEQEEEASSHVIKLLNQYKLVFRDHLFVWFIVADTLLYSMELQLTNYIGVRLNEKIANQHFLFLQVDGVQALGLLRTENTILVLAFSILTVKLVRNYSDKTVLKVGLLMFTVGFGLMTYLTNMWMLVFVMVIATIGEMIRVPVEQSYLAAIPPEDARSSYMAVSTISVNLSMLIASLTITISGFLSSWLTTAIVTGVGLTGMFILYVIMDDLQNRTEKANMAKKENVALEG